MKTHLRKKSNISARIGSHRWHVHTAKVSKRIGPPTHTYIHTHWNSNNEYDSLIRIMVSNGRFLSHSFIIKAASQGESQGERQEVESNDRKNLKDQILDTPSGQGAASDYCYDNARDKAMLLTLKSIINLSWSNLEIEFIF